MKAEDLKQIVKDKYGKIAEQSTSAESSCSESSCCGPSGCGSDVIYTVFSDNYKNKEGYNPDADMNLGCGIPTDHAGIKKGDHVLDLGSGAGNDCFIARAIVGETGKVTGLDFTDAMLKKAEENNKKLGFTNVEFVKGDIEGMPLPDNSFDVVISNCVLNLVPDKNKAFREIFRVLKPGGHFCVSDVVLKGELSEKMKKDAVMYAGCVSGASDIKEYLGIIGNEGFEKISIHKEKEIKLPEKLVTGEKAGIFSITVSAYKN